MTRRPETSETRYYFTGGYCLRFNLLYKTREEAQRALADHITRPDCKSSCGGPKHQIRRVA